MARPTNDLVKVVLVSPRNSLLFTVYLQVRPVIGDQIALHHPDGETELLEVRRVTHALAITKGREGRLLAEATTLEVKVVQIGEPRRLNPDGRDVVPGAAASLRAVRARPQKSPAHLIGAAVREARLALKISQKELALRIGGVNQADVSVTERGKIYSLSGAHRGEFLPCVSKILQYLDLDSNKLTLEETSK